MRRFLPFAALLGVALVLGCQDTGTGVVASDGAGPQFAKEGACEAPVHPSCKEGGNGDGGVDPGTLLSRAGGLDEDHIGYTCTGGAAISDESDNTSFGKVNWNQPRDDSHTHANVTLRNVDPGVYMIFGNHDRVCEALAAAPGAPIFDFPLRPGHATKVTVGENRRGKARIGLTYVTQTPKTIVNGGTIPGFDFTDTEILTMHVSGDHRLWVTVAGPLVDGVLPDDPPLVLRSTAVVVVIPGPHDLPAGGTH